MMLSVDTYPNTVLTKDNRCTMLELVDNGEQRLDGAELTTYADDGRLLHTYAVKVGPRGHLSLVEIR